MDPRRKPIPNPIPRGTAVRDVAAVRSGRSLLPTVAALLAATTALACQREPFSRTGELEIAPDRAEPAEIRTYFTKAKAKPSDPLPGMGALETVTEGPPKPYVPVGPTPTAKPYPVKGGMKSVHPAPSAPPMPGGLKAIHPYPPPTPTPGTLPGTPGTKKPPPVVADPAVETT